MVSTPELDLAEFRKAILQSEKVRTLCMIVVFGMFAMLGVFRILVPVDGKAPLGAVVFGYSLAFCVFDIVMLRELSKAIQADRPLPRVLATVQLILECFFPLGILYALMLLMPDFRYSLLVTVHFRAAPSWWQAVRWCV